jgi:hypothetical protein
MARVLVVSNPFGDFQRGDRITDADQIAAILAAPHASHVIASDHADRDPQALQPATDKPAKS